MLKLLLHYFPGPSSSVDYVNDQALVQEVAALPAPDAALIKSIKADPAQGSVKMIYHTRVGDGPRKLALADSLISFETGLPK